MTRRVTTATASCGRPAVSLPRSSSNWPADAGVSNVNTTPSKTTGFIVEPPDQSGASALALATGYRGIGSNATGGQMARVLERYIGARQVLPYSCEAVLMNLCACVKNSQIWERNDVAKISPLRVGAGVGRGRACLRYHAG